MHNFNDSDVPDYVGEKVKNDSYTSFYYYEKKTKLITDEFRR